MHGLVSDFAVLRNSAKIKDYAMIRMDIMKLSLKFLV